MNDPVGADGATVVIGVGNGMRRDDGAGPAVVERLRGRAPSAVELRVLDGEPGRLIEAWDGAALAVVIDAVRSGDTPGTFHLLVDAAPGDAAPTVLPRGGPGTHGAGVGEAVRLADVLGRLPDRLVVVGIEGEDFGEGPSLSPVVSDGLDVVVDEVLARIGEGAVRGGRA